MKHLGYLLFLICVFSSCKSDINADLLIINGNVYDGNWKSNKKNGEWMQYDSKGLPLRRSVYDMGMIIDDELIVLDGNEDNPMEELKDYTKKKRRSNKSKAKKSKSIFKLPSFLKK